MRVVKNSVPMLAVLLLSGVVAASPQGNSRVPSSVEAPIPTQASVPKSSIMASLFGSSRTPANHSAHSKPTAPVPTAPVVSAALVPSSASSAISAAPVASAASTVSAAPKTNGVYADMAPGQPNSTTQALPADVNTDIPYASVLPKGAEIVAGAPGKNEFFIVAAEDAAIIKQLVDHTKPGREVVAADIKSKQPIVKVKLDESNTTLVSMDVVTSVSTVAKAAVKPSVAMTSEDEVLTIYTKNKITPVGSRAVAVAAPVKVNAGPDEMDAKPMLKLLAMTDTAKSDVQASTGAIANPLETTAAVKPIKGTMPDMVAVKETIEQPTVAPVALPVASKEASPSLEMVLQQAKSGDKVKGPAAVELANAVRAADVKAKKEMKVVAVKSVTKAKQSAEAKATAAKVVAVKKSATQSSKKKVASAGKIISYEQIKPASKKNPWGARHAAAGVAVKKVAGTKTVDKKVAVKKRPMNVGVIHSYADYLTETGHRARHQTE